MSTVINIPQRNLSAEFNTGSVANPGFTSMALLVNRTVGAHPIDGFTGDVLAITVEHSEDGGATWLLDVTATVPGGVITAKGGGEVLASQVNADGFVPGQPVRARVTPLQGTVSVSGSLTLS